MGIGGNDDSTVTPVSAVFPRPRPFSLTKTTPWNSQRRVSFPGEPWLQSVPMPYYPCFHISYSPHTLASYMLLKGQTGEGTPFLLVLLSV
jgi:hypothetical protein